MIRSKQLSVMGLMAMALISSVSQAAHHRTHHTVRVRTDEPDLRSSSALVLDTTHQSVLYSRKADMAAPIASITKLMTVLVVADAGLPLDEPIELTTEDRIVGKGASSRLLLGTTLTRGDLIHLALMSSENRAAHALGRNYPGGLPAFVQAMNAKARKLGMTSAHFVDPAGLSCDNVASAEDLSKLVVAASENPVIREYSTDPGYEVRVGRKMLRVPQYQCPREQPDLEHHCPEDGLHQRSRSLPRDAGRHPGSHCGHRPPELRRQEHPGGRCCTDSQVDGSQAAH